MERKTIISGLAAVVVGISSILGTYSCPAYAEESKRTVNVQEENKRIIRKAAENYLYGFMRGDENRTGYIDFMAKNSEEIRNNIKLTSREGVIEGYVQFHRMCLDMAVSHIFQNINNEEVADLAEKLRQHQKSLAKETYINYENPIVKEGYLPFAKNRAEFFKKVIESNINSPSDDFNDLIRKTFSKEGFKESLTEYQEARVVLYNGFAESVKDYQDPKNKVWAWLIRIFGPGIASKTMKKSDEINMKELERIYGKN